MGTAWAMASVAQAPPELQPSYGRLPASVMLWLRARLGD